MPVAQAHQLDRGREAIESAPAARRRDTTARCRWRFRRGGWFGQGLAFDRPAAAAFALLRREVEQVGIETQAGDDTDMVADRGEKFDGCKRTVGDQNDIAIGEPALDLQGGLARPIEQRLGCSLLIGIETFGGERAE